MFLKLKSSGKEVKQLQTKLVELGYELGSVDGYFGKLTEKAVISFQISRQINADGVVGNITWRALFGEELPVVAILSPLFQPQLMSIFGDPHYSGWNATWLIPFSLTPWASKFGSDKIPKRIWVNKVIEQSLIAVLHDLASKNLLSEIVTYDGCHNVRFMKGSNNKLSVHSWALAIDWNQATNPYGGKVTFSKEFINVWSDHGWESGALWTKSDGMHVQYCWTKDWRNVTGAYKYLKPILN